jgi:hypothetical protein
MCSFTFASELPLLEEVCINQVETQLALQMAKEEKRKEKENIDIFFVQEYIHRIRRAVENAIQEINNRHTRVQYSTLNLSLDKKLVVKNDHDNSSYEISFYELYNGVNYNFDQYELTPNPIFADLFKELQTSLAACGYYLSEVSEPTQELKINLYVDKSNI